ncbi:MAG: L-serine ammonia-lyase, iron-sulfur-dependent, subunit alpha [Paludibacteraceae bacterium]|nr:L-serine ammonia-lyase, iron-sulfur-dependent, subunit alpha [Paludibacteraceae bacterium]
MTNPELLQLLRREVIPAIGCTEPIAVALCVARAKELLGVEPDEITVYLSKNVYKNALAVGIPNTGMTGLPIAIALGATVGKSEYLLEVLRDATPEAVAYAKEYMLRVPAQIHINYEAPSILYIHAEVRKGDKTAQATIMDGHTNFVEEASPKSSPKGKDFSTAQNTLPLREGMGIGLNLRRVYDFAMEVDIHDITFLTDGAEMNTAAAETSFADQYGHGLGRLLRANTLTATPEMEKLFGNTLFTKIISYTCGACDARMSGAMVQVMSNSGSGNQGISCSIPVYLYAKENGCSEERTLRALALSNLTVIYIKQSLGRLSALCGCVVAATGSAAGITYLMGGNYEEITYAIKNMIANISGMICDGAKPGCALKVTSGVATAIFSAYLAMQHSFADSTEGIVEDDIDRTIRNLTRIGHDGMKVTDDLILDIMTHKQ